MFRIGPKAIRIGWTRELSAHPRAQIRWFTQTGRLQAEAQAQEQAQEKAQPRKNHKHQGKPSSKTKLGKFQRGKANKSRKDISKSLHETATDPGKNSNGASAKSIVKFLDGSSKVTPKAKKPGAKASKLQGVFYTQDYIRSTYEVPTASQYGYSSENTADFSRIVLDSGIITRVHHRNVSLRHAPEGKVMVECTLKAKVGDGPPGKWTGHGATAKEAQDAAAFRLFCELHKSGDLLQINQYLDPGQPRLRREANAKTDIIDYAARYDCLPVFSFRRTSRNLNDKPFKAHVSIPDLELNGYGRARQVSTAILAASISLKNAAEARHGKTGAGTLLVKDYTNLTTHSAEKFVRFYCYHQRLECSAQHYPSKENEDGGVVITEVTLKNNVTLNNENGISLLKQAWKSIADSDAWPGVSQGEGDNERTYRGIPMMSREDSDAVGYLAAAMPLRRESPCLWQKFVKEMRRGNGDVLKYLSPIDMGIKSATIDIMEDMLQKTTAVQNQNSFAPISEDNNALRIQYSRQLTGMEVEKKDVELLERLNYYEKNSNLTQLRRLRSELPMTQHRAQVMDMINRNDVCVIVGATGSGKTTQVPQMILDDLIRTGQGGSCNVICTQPRRIAALSVAKRVAVERNERPGQSIGYSVRFDSKPPDFGGSVHYLTTGVLLKQMQETQAATLEGISHIIVDEVHERDLNNDFLLVLLKTLMRDRKAAGLPTIKVILMSATIDTSLFCKYFGDGFPNNMCPYIEVPGRTFPVTSHYLDDINFELRRSYSKDHAPDLYSRESQLYINTEMEGQRPAPLRATPDLEVEDIEADKSDEKTAVINWKSKGFVDTHGEVDIATNREDTVTPVRLMGVTIAHLLKTTTEGSILVFLPGLQEIIELERQLNNTKPLGIDFANNPDYRIYVLHSSLPQMQQDVFAPVAPGKRKIILATNIAETSVTIPDVVYVLDSSKHRETQYDRTRRISSLVSAWTSKSNARQRAGRAGRVQHGHYYTMASKARYKSFRIAPQPEILRTDLQVLCLQIKSTGVKDIRDFLDQAIEPPQRSAVGTAIEELQALRALDQDENLTPLGRYLSLLPLPPSIGKMVVLGAVFRCLDPVLILAAAQTSRSPFLSPLDRREEAVSCHERWGMGTGSDHTAVINAFQEWRRLKRTGRGSRQPERQFAYENFLHHDTLSTIARTADQIQDILQSTGLVDGNPQPINGIASHYGSVSENLYSESQALRVALATAGFYPNIAVRRKGSLPRFLRTVYENEAAIFPYSLAAPKSLDGKRYGKITEGSAAPIGTLFTFADKTQADDHGIFLRSVARTYPLAVYLFGGKSTVQGQVFTVDEWLPFYVRKREKFLLQRINAMLQDFLERTFDRLRATKQIRKDRSPGLKKQQFLEQDKMRAPLVKGIVEALESCAPMGSHSTMHMPGLYDYSQEQAIADLLDEFCSSSSSAGSIDSEPTLVEAQPLTEAKNFYGNAEYKPHEIEGRPQGFYKDERWDQSLRDGARAYGKGNSPPRIRNSRKPVEGFKPGSTVLGLLQKWGK